MAHKTKTSINRHIIYMFLICIILFCVLACGSSSNDDRRTQKELDVFLKNNDSLVRLDSNILSVCDSIMAYTKDSLTYHDYNILKARYFLLSKHIDSALIYARKTRTFVNTLPVSQRTMGLKALANSTEASYYHILRRNPKKTIALNSLAYNQILESDLKYYAPEIAANLADAYIAIDDLPTGAKWYRKALFLIDSLKLPRTKNITLYMGLGQIYTTMKDYASAKHYYEMSERQFDKMKPNMQSYFLNNYGNYFYYTRNYQKALQTFRRLKKHLNESNAEETYDMYLCAINMADIFLNLDMLDSAKIYVDKAAQYFEENKIGTGIYYANTIKIGIALKNNEYGDIERILKTENVVEDYNQNIKNIRSRYLREYYVKSGNYQMAYYDLLNNMLQNDSMEHNRTYMKAAEIMMRYTEDTLKLHYQIELKEKNAEVNKSKATLWLFISIALALSSIIGCGIIIIRKHKIQTRMVVLMLRLNNARQRISPHFVFNILNAKIGPVHNEETDILVRLTKLLRASLDMTGKAYVTLYEELQFTMEYINLERMLMGNDFEVNIIAPEETIQNEIHIPAMFIQILVENAIKHGLKNVIGNKKLDISIESRDSTTIIEVIDNGPGFDIRRNGNGRIKNGLAIIRQTISILNQENHGISKIQFNINNLEDDDGHVCGCKAMLSIPQTIKYI